MLRIKFMNYFKIIQKTNNIDIIKNIILIPQQACVYFNNLYITIVLDVLYNVSRRRGKKCE